MERKQNTKNFVASIEFIAQKRGDISIPSGEKMVVYESYLRDCVFHATPQQKQ
jgi:hypothetical protein